jgi:hypothetical protein
VSESQPSPAVGEAFYCVSDRRHFVGVVALLNSLRLVGHEQTFYLVDAGLTAEQRQALQEHVKLIPAPQNACEILLTPFAPLRHPAEVAVLLDADIMVVRPLTELLELAGYGRLVVFQNNPPNDNRFFPEWQAALKLGRLRRQAYFNCGLVVLPHSANRLLRQWNEGLSQVEVEQTWHGRGDLSEPFYFGDQDVLNAVAAATLEPSELAMLEHRLAPHPPFNGLRLLDPQRLTCEYADHTQPFVLHHVLAKPWLKPTPDTVYSRLLRRLLLEPDVTLRLDPGDLPLRLRRGRLAAADRRRAHVQATAYAHVRHQVGRLGLRGKLFGSAHVPRAVDRR